MVSDNFEQSNIWSNGVVSCPRQVDGAYAIAFHFLNLLLFQDVAVPTSDDGGKSDIPKARTLIEKKTAINLIEAFG